MKYHLEEFYTFSGLRL